MDDIVIFSATKKCLHKYLIFIDHALYKLGLHIKENRKIVRFIYKNDLEKIKGHFLDYMGFRFYRGYTTLRKSIYIRMCRKARAMSKKDRLTLYDIRQFLSYLGWIKHSTVYNAYLKYIKPYVNVQYMKRRMSRYDKRKEKNNELVICAC